MAGLDGGETPYRSQAGKVGTVEIQSLFHMDRSIVRWILQKHNGDSRIVETTRLSRLQSAGESGLHGTVVCSLTRPLHGTMLQGDAKLS